MVRRKQTDVELLAEIASAFAGSLDLENTFGAILRLLDEHVGLQQGMITLLDPDSELIHVNVAHGVSAADAKSITYRVGEGITGTVVQSGKEIVSPDIHKDPRFLNKMGSRERARGVSVAFFCVPIKLEDRTIGALSVYRQVRRAEDFNDNLRLLHVVATLIAQAVRLNRLVEEDRAALQSENARLRRELKSRFNIHNMVGTSNAMQAVYRLIEQVANSNATVLIRGESGTGKDLVAHAIHYNSYRADKPFIKVNCTALPDTLLESELFGHEKGAFTGASERKLGRFELAEGGTIFLDEIGDFSLNLQIKLLRVIQFKEFERLGGRETIKANVRIIVATHKDLEREIKSGLFREDLYYRINVFPIFMPPLRERKDDVMLLADYFLEKYAQENNKRIVRISTPAIRMLTSYHWPGNIRELENCIERAVLVCDDDVVRSEHLPPSLQMVRDAAGPPKTERTMPDKVAALETECIVDALKKTGGRQRAAARELGITERQLGYKIRKYGIVPKAIV